MASIGVLPAASLRRKYARPSVGGLNVVFAAVRELRPWRNERAVQEVSDRLLTLMTAA